MLKNSNGAGAHWKNTQNLLRLAIGVLVAANLLAAAFAFHWFGNPAEETQAQVRNTQHQLAAVQSHLTTARTLSSKVEQARSAGEHFLTTYMTDRRNTYSTVLAELNRVAVDAGMKSKEKALPPLEPIEGSDNLSIMTITANYEGTYPQLVKFVNLLDKSQRFIIIESLQAAPQQGTNNLNISIRVNTFVRGDFGGAA
jgi:Tfp pilus assembly protein PilO